MSAPFAAYASTIVASLLLAAAALPAQDLRRVSGTVLDSTGTPIPYVSVDGGPRFRTLSNAVGEFTLMLPQAQAFEITIRRIGYLPGKIRVLAGSDTSVGVSLQQLGVLMATQVIRAREQVRNLAVRGFYQRMADTERGGLNAEFVTPEEVEMRNPMRTSQLLDQKRGIRVRRVGNCYVVSTCYRIFGSSGCSATVYLDGRRLNNLAQSAAGQAAPEIDDLVPVTGVSGIEIYARASQAPPQFQSMAGTCPIVLVWTK
jgi:hypothetical protein